MGELTREELLKIASPAVESVETSQGDKVYIRRMSFADRDGYLASIDGGNNMHNFKGKLLARCLCDAEGNRLMEDGDADALGKHAPGFIDPIIGPAWKLNNLGEDQQSGN